ncbi:MAG TPA: type II toxin-antitoxin system VapC family toxin [Conexibacter sp.]|nr:type II toxin-antitoxin system VapC family toxin [Conexibacter sp.]
MEGTRRHVALRRGRRGHRPRVRDARLRLLLDSHVLVWFATADRALAADVSAAIRDDDTVAAVSVASVWELEIKRAKGMLELPQDVGAQLSAADFDLLDVTLAHVVCAAELPPYHRDPFDRLLVAQARTEQFTLVTADGAVKRYDVPVMRARAGASAG